MVPVKNRGNLAISRYASPALLSPATSQLVVYPSADAGFAASNPIFLFTELNLVTNFRTDTHENHSGFLFHSVGWTPDRGASGDCITLESLIGVFYEASTRRGSSRRLGYVKSSTSMVRRTAPIQHQPKLRGDIHVIPLSNWQADGIRRPSHSPRNFSLITTQEYSFGGIFRIFDPGKAVETQVDFISETFHEDNHANHILNQQTGHKNNSRDSGSSSEDGGKIYGRR